MILTPAIARNGGEERIRSTPWGADHDSTTTAALIRLAREGHAQARNVLSARFLDFLKRWADASLPSRTRSVVDVDDLVQTALCRALRCLEWIEFRGEESLLAYLRQILRNELRTELRRVSRRPRHVELKRDLPSQDRSPLEQLIDREPLVRYEQALVRLAPMQRRAVVLRVEFGMSYPEIAIQLGLPTRNAARALVCRGLIRLRSNVGSRAAPYHPRCSRAEHGCDGAGRGAAP